MTLWILGYILIGALLMLLARWTARPSASESFDSVLYKLHYPPGTFLKDRCEEWLIQGLAHLLLIAVWPVLLPWGIYERLNPTRPYVLDDSPQFRANASNLTELVTVESVEARERIEDPLHAAPAMAFGHMNRTWEKFKTDIQSGDELWRFSAPADKAHGTCLSVRGYAIRRDGEIVAEIVSDGG